MRTLKSIVFTFATLALVTVLLSTPAQAQDAGPSVLEPNAEFHLANCDPGDYPGMDRGDANVWTDHDGDGEICLELNSTASGDDGYLIDRFRCGAFQDDLEQELAERRWYVDDPAREEDPHSSQPVTTATFAGDDLVAQGADHAVLLEVTDYCGNNDTAQENVALHPNTPPTVDDLNVTCDGPTCTTNAILSDPGPPNGEADPQPTFTCTWRFGDGNSTTNDCADVSHTYDREEPFTVELNVSDRGGANTTDAVTVEPVASFPDATINLRVCQTNGTVQIDCSFTASNSTDPDGGDIANYTWRFGDGTTLTTTTPNVSHTYDEGEYSVDVTVGDGDARNATNTSEDIHLDLETTPEAAFDERNGCSLNECVFNASASLDPDHQNASIQDAPGDGILVYAWDLGDGTRINTTDPTLTHEYPFQGTYEIDLTVVDDEGATARTTQTLEVPRTSIVPDAEAECHGRNCILDARGTTATDPGENIVDTTWKIPTSAGDVVERDGPVVVHRMDAYSGTNVTLTAESDQGETVSESLHLPLDAFVDEVSFSQGAGEAWSLSGFWADDRTCPGNSGDYLSYTQQQGEKIIFGQRDPTGLQEECSYETGSSHAGNAVLTLPSLDATGANISLGHQGELTNESTQDRGDFARVEARTAGADWTFCGAEWNNTNPLPDAWTTDDCLASHLGPGDGSDLEVRLRMEADGFEDDNEGWFVRNLTVERRYTGPIAWHGGTEVVHDHDRDGEATVELNATASANPDGPITSVAWTAENGSVIARENTTSIERSVGVHLVQLNVTGTTGTSLGDVTDRETKEIVVNAPPVAAAEADPGTTADTDGDGTEEVTLDGTPSTDEDGAVEEFIWKDADGTIVGSGPQITVQASIGDTTYDLEAVDDRGARNTTDVTVTVTENEAPDASFEASCSGLDCTFNASETTDDGDDLDYEWEFGDGATASSGPTVTHEYPDQGTFDVTLEVTDAAGESDTATGSVVVDLPLNETFDGSDTFPSGWETGEARSEADNLWRVGSTCTASPQGGNHLTFSELVDTTCSYDTGEVEGWVSTPTIPLSHADEATVTLHQNRSFDDEGTDFDVAYLDARSSPQDDWEVVAEWGDSTDGWTTSNLTLGSSLVTDETQLRFRFDSGDGTQNDEPGWFVDHVRVQG